MSIVATCATIAAALASAQGGETISLKNQKCGTVVVLKSYPRQVQLALGGSEIALDVRKGAGNIRVRSGVLRATGGKTGFAAAGYGALIRGAKVRLEEVRVTDAKKGVVLDGASDVTIVRSRFVALGEDGIIASATKRLVVMDNVFADTTPTPTSCTTAGGVIPGLSSRDCVAKGGTWKDGSHADAVQLRNGVTDATIARNDVRTAGQGLTQMDTTGDAPLERIMIRDNRVKVDGHHITLGANCVGCTIRGNVVLRWRPDGFKAVIRQGSAMRCGNQVQDEKVQDQACAA